MLMKCFYICFISTLPFSKQDTRVCVCACACVYELKNQRQVPSAALRIRMKAAERCRCQFPYPVSPFLSTSVYFNSTHTFGYSTLVIHYAKCREYKKARREGEQKEKKNETHSPCFYEVHNLIEDYT